MEDLRNITKNALARVLKPVARFCIHHGISAPELWGLVKSSFVQAAVEDLKSNNETPARSRVAMMTGLSRPAVASHWAESHASAESQASQERLNYGQRIVAAWLRDPEFSTTPGHPRVLVTTGGPGSFEALVLRYGANIPYRSVLEDFKARGIATENTDQVELLRHSYIPADVDATKLVLLGINAGNHLDTIERNLRGDLTPYFERKVSFRHLRPSGIALLHRLAEAEAQGLLEKMDELLAAHAADEEESDTAHAGLGMFVYVEKKNDDA